MKAFDRVEWPVIQQTLSKFNFRDSLRHWIPSTVMQRALVLTITLPFSRGVRQGCPLLPHLFILLAEILASEIRHDKNM